MFTWQKILWIPRSLKWSLHRPDFLQAAADRNVSQVLLLLLLTALICNNQSSASKRLIPDPVNPRLFPPTFCREGSRPYLCCSHGICEQVKFLKVIFSWRCACCRCQKWAPLALTQKHYQVTYIDRSSTGSHWELWLCFSIFWGVSCNSLHSEFRAPKANIGALPSSQKCWKSLII